MDTGEIKQLRIGRVQGEIVRLKEHLKSYLGFPKNGKAPKWILAKIKWYEDLIKDVKSGDAHFKQLTS